MKTPLTPSQFQSVKFSAVCSYEAYLRLWDWQKSRYKVYPIDVTKSFYRATTNRFYMSRWLESVISAYCRWAGWRVQKPYDKGTVIKSKQGKEIWVKTRHSRVGEADLLVIANGKVINIECKVKHDRQNEAQIKEQERAEANNEAYVIVKELGDWWAVVDGLDVKPRHTPDEQAEFDRTTDAFGNSYSDGEL